MHKKSAIGTHLMTVSKSRPAPAFIPACDSHATEKQQKKCHKGKIPPPA